MADNANDVNTTPVVTQEPTPTEPSAVETNAPAPAAAETPGAPEVADDLLDLWGDDESTPKPTEPKPKEDAPAEGKPEDKPQEEPVADKPTDEKPKDDAEKPEDQSRGKQDANSRIRQLVNEKKELSDKVAALTRQTYRTNTVEELVEQGMSETDARLKVIEQGKEIDTFERNVTDLNVQFDAEANLVLEDFPMFNPESQGYVPELADAARELYEQAADLQTDENTGFFTQVKVLPHKFYKTIADAYQKGIESGKADGQVSGRVAAEQMLAAVDASTSVTPTPGKKDEIADLWGSDD